MLYGRRRCIQCLANHTPELSYRPVTLAAALLEEIHELPDALAAAIAAQNTDRVPGPVVAQAPRQRLPAVID
jgi:hypothetical protein